ncbi:MAG: hypothetical protein QXE91_07750 [Thermofilaceae archaeon]
MNLDLVRASLVASWILLSTLLGLSHPQTAPAPLLSAAIFALALLRRSRTLVALAVALQLPTLVAMSLERSLVQAALLTLASLYLAELGDLVARAGPARDLGYLRRKFEQVTGVAALALPVTAAVTAAAESLSLVLDFGLAVLLVAILVLLALSLRRPP